MLNDIMALRAVNIERQYEEVPGGRSSGNMMFSMRTID